MREESVTFGNEMPEVLTSEEGKNQGLKTCQQCTYHRRQYQEEIPRDSTTHPLAPRFRKRFVSFVGSHSQCKVKQTEENHGRLSHCPNLFQWDSRRLAVLPILFARDIT